MKRSLFVAMAAALAAAAPAVAKEGAQAHLLAPLPAHPAAGMLISVRWSVDVPGTGGKRVPFGAIGMFVRLVGRDGASTIASAAELDGPPYSARIRVPRAGIRAIRFGLRGTTDIYFPLR